MTGLVDKRIEMDIGSMEFIRVFDNISHKILLEKLYLCRLYEQVMKLTENWMNLWSQMLVIRGTV